MLNPIAFANSLAILTVVVHLIFHLVRLIAPIGFRFLFNAQFMGADVASLLWRDIPAGTIVISFILAVAVSWLFAYAWAWLYNRLAR